MRRKGRGKAVVEGLYRVEAGMSTKMVRMEILANNLANIDTVGFKRDKAFSEELNEASAKAAADGSGTLEIRQVIDFSEGSLQQTGNQLDAAIQGSGFFVVNTPAGQRYTRNGNFQMTLDGTIVTSEGYPVEGENGALRLPDVQKLGNASVQISGTGEVTVDKQSVGTLKIVDFADYQALVKDQGSLFMAKSDALPVEGLGKQSVIRQGYLEESNVEGIEEMVSMIELSRNFEAEQKALQSQDTSLGQAIEVARVS